MAQIVRCWFSDFETALLELAVEAMYNSLVDSKEKRALMPLVEKMRVLSCVGEGGELYCELTFSGKSTEGIK